MKNNKRQPRNSEPKPQLVSEAGISLKKAFWIIAFLISIVTFIIYIPALSNGFVNWDDNVYVYDNQNIQSLNSDFLKWIFTADSNPTWHPLTLLTIGFDYSIWELDAKGYHLTNIVFHILNTILVFMLSVRLVAYGSLYQKVDKKALISGAITAGLFSIHPLHVESVAWISERKDVLSSFFYLLALLSYLKYVSIDSKKVVLYLKCLIFFIMALMSKPMAISLPIVLLILDFYPLKRLRISEIRNSKQVLIEKIPFFVLSLLSAIITIWVHRISGLLQTFEDIPPLVRFFAAMRAYIFYLFKMVLPVNLVPIYPYPDNINFFTLQYVGSSVLLLVITFFSIRSLKRGKLFFAVWFYYIITLLPVIGIVKVGGFSAADRYTYLPSLGPFLLAGLGVGYFFERYSKKVKITIITLVLLTSGILINRTIKQIYIWHDSVTLWSHEIAVYPETVPLSYYNLGHAYNSLGSYQQGVKYLDRAIDLNPQYIDALIMRGLAYDALGEYPRAISDFDRAIELSPRNTNAFNNRGMTNCKLGNYQGAINDFNMAVEINPRNASAYNNRGNAYFSLESYKQAIMDYNRAIELNHQNSRAYNNRGNAYKNMGDFKQAILDLTKAIELNPQNAKVYYTRGSSYMNLGKDQQALDDFRMAAGLGLKEAQDYLNEKGVK